MRFGGGGASAGALPGRRLVAISLPAVLATGACQEPADLTLPTAEGIESYYEDVVGLEEADINGNVAVVVVRQPPEQLRRGGSIWAKVGPYVYLFSEETRALMDDHPGLAAVRVVTRTASGVTVASALLARDELTEVLWRRSLNVSGLARRDGSERVTLLEDLIEWGEDHTDFEYNARFVPRR